VLLLGPLADQLRADPFVGDGVLGAAVILRPVLLKDLALGQPPSVKEYGSSYIFSPVVDGENSINPKIYTRRGIFSVSNVGRLTVASDFTGIHPRRAGEQETPFIKNGMNALKADGRVIQR
jgi:hypothetical protein